MRRGTLALALLLLLPLGEVRAVDPVGAAYGPCVAAVEELGLDDTPAHEACVRQMDGGSPGDASDACASPSPTVQIGVPFQGWLAPPADPEDDYALLVPAANLPLVLTVASEPGAGVRHEVTAWAPSASGTRCAVPLGTATPGQPFSFTAPVAGSYVLQVVEVPDAPPLPPTRMCHLMCALQDATGYHVEIG